MTEIKLDVADPVALVAMLREMLPVNADEINPYERPTVERICAQIEEQLPKSAVEEPEEFGSLIRATCGPDLVGVLWQKCPEKGKHYWEAETGAVDVWSELTDIGVLRVGVGEVSNESKRDAYLQGRQDFAGAVQRELTELEASVLTFPEQRCYKDATAMVARLLGES